MIVVLRLALISHLAGLAQGSSQLEGRCSSGAACEEVDDGGMLQLRNVSVEKLRGVLTPSSHAPSSGARTLQVVGVSESAQGLSFTEERSSLLVAGPVDETEKTFRGRNIQSPVKCSVSMASFPMVIAGTLVFALLFGTYFTDMIASSTASQESSTAFCSTPKLAFLGEEVFRLRLAAWTAVLLTTVQVTGAVWANSAALFAQTFQLISEANEGVLSICALELMGKCATAEHTFGLQQAGALGTFLSVLLVWLLGAVLSVQYVHRAIHLENVDGFLIVVFTAAGMLARMFLWRFVGVHKVNLVAVLSGNQELAQKISLSSPRSDVGVPTLALSQLAAGSFPGMPVLSVPRATDRCVGTNDALATTSRPPAVSRSSRFLDASEERRTAASSASVAQADHCFAIELFFSALVMAVGALVWLQPFAAGEAEIGVSRWCYSDLIVALAVTTRMILSTRGAINEALMQLLMACPRNFNLHAFQQDLKSIEGVTSLHDLHLWQTGRSRCCTAHLVVKEVNDAMQVLRRCHELARAAHIDEATFQIDVDRRSMEERLRLSCTTCHDTLHDATP